MCGNTDFLSGISCCLEKDCSKEDIQSTIKFASGLCNASGVKTPTQLICNKKPGSSSGVSSSTTATATTPAASGSQTSSATGTPTASRTNAAAPVYANAGGVLGAVVAVVALL